MRTPNNEFTTLCEEMGSYVYKRTHNGVKGFRRRQRVDPDLGVSLSSTLLHDIIQNCAIIHLGTICDPDDGALHVVGKGDADLLTSNGTIWSLKNR